jgi:TonB family protein
MQFLSIKILSLLISINAISFSQNTGNVEIEEEEEITLVFADSLNDDADTIPDCRQLQSEPSFPGGDAAFFTYLKSHLIFSEEMKNLGISGTVYVQFIVNKDGTLSDVIILKGIHPLFDAETIRFVQNMPNWIPGINSCNLPVKMRCNLPIKFEIH